MKKKLLIMSFVIYIVIILIATKALLDRNELGVFATKNNYYICSEKIKEYDNSSLVHFDRNADYEKMIGEDVYYFDMNNELQSGKLTQVDKENKMFSINKLNYENDRLLGRPDKAYQIVGSLLNIMTSRAFYLLFVIIPIIGLFIYEIHLLILYLSRESNRKEEDNDKRTKKKDK